MSTIKFGSLLLLISTLPFTFSKSSCTTLLHEVTSAIYEFDQCALSKAVPVGLCFGCIKHFDNVTESYKMLLTGNETTSDEIILCADEYLNHDGLNVVESMFLHTKQIWEEAHCESCFNRKKNTVLKCPDVQEFEKLYELFKDCKKEKHSGQEKPDFCKICLSQYNQLFQVYKLLKKGREGLEAPGEICFDIQDRVRLLFITVNIQI